MKHHIILYLVLLVLLFLLGGCLPSSEVSVEMVELADQTNLETATLQPSGKLTLTSSLWDTPEEQVYIINEIIKPFEETHGVTVSFQVLDDATQFERAGIQQASQNVITDVFITSVNQMDEWIESGYAADITTTAEALADRTFITAFDETLYQGTTRRFIPLTATTYVLVINNNAFFYLPKNVSLNQLDWINFAGWANAVTTAQGGGKVCVAGAPGGDITSLLGSTALAYDGGYPEISTDSMLEVWALWISMGDAIGSQSLTYQSCIEAMTRGEAWLSFMKPQDAEAVISAEPETFSVIQLPVGQAGIGAITDMSGIGVMENAPNPELAAVFIDYITQPDVLLKLNTFSAFTIPGLLEVKETLDIDPHGKIIRAGLTTLSNGIASGTLEDEFTDWSSVMALYENAFAQMVITGDGNIDQELLTIANETLEGLRE